MKLQDYAHYYIGCRCLDTWFPEGHEHYNNNWTLAGYVQDMEKPYCLENKLNNTWTDSIKLILHKIDSMNHKEWAKIKNELSAFLSLHGINVAYKDKPYWVLILENRINTNTLLFNDGMVLIKHGYDVFGLIESGLAIDSKTLK